MVAAVVACSIICLYAVAHMFVLNRLLNPDTIASNVHAKPQKRTDPPMETSS